MLDVSYPSFVSYSVFNEQGTFVSAAHCQEGYESKLSVLVPANLVETNEELRGGKIHKKK